MLTDIDRSAWPPRLLSRPHEFSVCPLPRSGPLYPAFDLAGRVALVTGGNGGIGMGMAEASPRH